jgi:hypothetical protein
VRKIKYEGEILEVLDIIMAMDENNPGGYVYKVTFPTHPDEPEYLPLDEVEVL